jgi:hypothetical protein
MRRLVALALLLLPSVAWAQDYNNPSTLRPGTVISVVSAANTQVTATLPAAGAGLFHYITGIYLFHSCTTAVTGSAINTITTTNLPGSLAFTNGNACAVGSDNPFAQIPLSSTPLKSSVANTDTTFVCPAQGAAAFCRMNIFYFIAP